MKPKKATKQKKTRKATAAKRTESAKVKSTTRATLRIEGAGTAIAEFREEQGVSQVELGKLLGWDKTRLWKYENDKLALSLPVLDNIANALDTDPLILHIRCLKLRYPLLRSVGSEPGRLIQQLEEVLANCT